MIRNYTLQEAVVYGHGTERPFLCPVHGDSRPSASLNMIKKVWFCYTCGAHGDLTGEAACIEPDYDQLREWISSKLAERVVYPEAWLSRWDAGDPHPYWVERVGVAAAKHFRLGYDADRNAVTYPLRDRDQKVLGVVRRALDADSGPKYRYPSGIDVGKLLFNYTPEHRRAVVLCEGALDAIALWRAGVDAFAIYGAHFSPEQVHLVDQVDPDYVFTAFDNDDAGALAHWNATKALPHRLITDLTWPRSWGKDVDEIGLDRLKKLVGDVVSLNQTAVASSSWTPSSKPSSPPSSQPRKLRVVPTGT